MKKIILMLSFCVVTVMLTAQTTKTVEAWNAPKEADNNINKFKSEDDINIGSEMYLMYCSLCHGEMGQGDGPAGTGLPIPAADFTSEKVKKQSDGAVYWKLSTGRGNMVSYKSVLTEEERWQIVSFIRTLSDKE